MPRDPLLLIVVVDFEVELFLLAPFKAFVVGLIGLAWVLATRVGDGLAFMRFLEVVPVARVVESPVDLRRLRLLDLLLNCGLVYELFHGYH